MKFRKKPVVIDAMQWTGENTSEVIDWVLTSGTRSARYHEEISEAEPEYIAIDTLEGTMRADVGDWIIRGVQGEHYPCKPDIFEATYEPVSRAREVTFRLELPDAERMERVREAVQESAKKWREGKA